MACEAKDITEDCTIFFGGKPIEFVYHAENETVEFTVPPGLPGDKTIHAQCGDSGVKLIEKNFNVPSAGGGDSAAGDAVPPEGGAGDTGTAGGEEIIPEGTPSGTGGATTGGEAPPPDSDGDGVADTVDACPGTVSGTAVDGTGCPPPPPTPTGAEILKFVVEKSADSGAQLMTFHVAFEFVRAKEAYVWGNVLNRTPSDGDLAAAEQCKIQGDRSLRTNEIGKKLNPGTDPYTKLPVEGVLCDNTNASTADDCKSSSSSARLDLSPMDGSRFEDPLLKKDLYALQYQLPKGGYLEQVSPDKMIAVTPGLIEFIEKNPSCRLDLKKDGNLVTAGEFFTRSHAQYGNLCLVLRGEDDGWKVQCLTGDKLKAANVAITSSSVHVPSDKMAVTLKLDYSPGTSAQATGCTKKADAVQSTGQGHYEGECVINTLTKKIDVTVYGVGEHNKQKKAYAIELGSPTVTLKPMGAVPLENETGDFKLQYKAVRDFTIKDGDTVLQSGEASWFSQTYFEGFPSGNGWKAVSSPSEFGGEVAVTQDVSHSHWSFAIKDFDGSIKGASYDSPGFPKEFTTKQTSGGGGMVITGTETFPPPGVCSGGIPIRVYHYFNWEGQNIKSIAIEGDAGIEKIEGLEDKVGFDAGSLRVYKDVVHKGSWSIDASNPWKFTIVATHRDGTTTTKRSWSMTGWSCN